MAPSGKALLLPGSLAARKPILISQILPTVCSILARVRPEPIIARVGQPGPSEEFTFAETHEDVQKRPYPMPEGTRRDVELSLSRGRLMHQFSTSDEFFG